MLRAVRVHLLAGLDILARRGKGYDLEFKISKTCVEYCNQTGDHKNFIFTSPDDKTSLAERKHALSFDLLFDSPHG